MTATPRRPGQAASRSGAVAWAALGLVVAIVAGVAPLSSQAADSDDSPVALAARYGGVESDNGRATWPPRLGHRSAVTEPLPLGGGEEASSPAPLAAPLPAPLPALGPPDLQAAQATRASDARLSEVLAEVRLGLLAHDVGVFNRGRETGADVSLEVYFAPPSFLAAIWSPRPLIGVALNSAGNTSQVYGGLAWRWPFREPFFIEGALTLAAHDGKLSDPPPDRQALGCRVLFRESITLGARLFERHTIALQLAHMSNAGLCADNVGLDTFGVQYGYSF